MCTVCGLHTTHSNLTQTLGLLSLFSFGLTTFLGAWWIITSSRLQQWWNERNQRTSSGTSS